MNLLELQERKKTKLTTKALREHYNMELDLTKLNVKSTQSMLSKIKNLLSETRTSIKIHESEKNANYLKLLMLEQTLAGHLEELRRQSQVVVENEEVQKSQVILAAQDMIDSIQKMIEQVSKMNVEELNAVVEGMRNEFGTEAGDQFNTSVGQTLKTLQDSLTNAKNELGSALGVVTGEAPAAPEGELGGMGGADQELGAPEEMPGDSELPTEPEAEEPDAEPGNLGRERR